MIHVQSKRYRVVLWESEDRSSAEPALRLEFDRLAEADAEFEKLQRAGRYPAGILIEWLKDSGDWELVRKYPQ